MMYTDLDKTRSFNESNDNNLEEDFRNAFERDYARVIHSPSFRRLQGKTQLFPSIESDFFRNRLTHSLEVAQLAKGIANKINSKYFPNDKDNQIDLDLVNFAGISHDLGHPPFGHQGEEALNECMHQHGGFEGNAQTLRILSKLEKKIQIGDVRFGGFDQQKNGLDKREGLNLTYRSLASILKYNTPIFVDSTKRDIKDIKVKKGYYHLESDLVSRIIGNVSNGKKYDEPFKTIECQIMDIADDIAYSTFDLEDVFKSGFINPFDILSAKKSFYEKVSEKVTKAFRAAEDYETTIDRDDVIDVISDIFKELFDLEQIDGFKELKKVELSTEEYVFMGSQYAYRFSQSIAKDGYLRTAFSSKLVSKAISSIKFERNYTIPALSKLSLSQTAKIRIEILKQVAFQTQILSPKLKIVEYRGKEIIKKIFETLIKGDGFELLPDDFRIIYENSDTAEHRYRTVCDYVACMTDKYAIEFYGRLTSENPETIFKPY